ncbi:MAG TPA: OstA-like protein [Bacteroidota bacterium]
MRIGAATVWMIFLAANAAVGQSGKVIELRSARQMENRIIEGEDVRDFTGNVHFVQPGEDGEIRLWCDRARQYMKRGRVDLSGNVRIVQDSMTLRGSQGTYFSRDGMAFMRAGVLLERGDMTLTAREGDYDANADRAEFRGDVVVIDSVSTTYCDSLIYFQDGDRSVAMGQVVVRNPRDGVTVFGDSLLHYGDINYAVVPKNPRMVQIDTAADGSVDTLVVIGKIMEAFRDTSRRYTVNDSVFMVRNDLAAKCGDALYRPSEGLTILRENPVVWYGGNQISGDSIAVRLEGNKLKSVFVAGRAMAVSKADSMLTERFDQLTGRELTLFFDGQNIERIEAVRNAISLYYLFDDSLANGVNRSSGDKIIVNFTEGQVSEINVIGGVEGVYSPEEVIAAKERTLNLDGFQWRTDRPRRFGTHVMVE